MTHTINIAIIGASGYTGAELIRLLLTHPHANISALTGDSQAGKEIGDVYPHLRFKGLPKLVTLPEVDFTNIDLAFCCLPHGTTQEVIAKLFSLPNRGRAGVGAQHGQTNMLSKNAPLPASPLQGEELVVIDLSADFRLFDVEEYAQWYGHAHQSADLQKEAVYGLTELAREKIKNARLIANPGCYPTSAILPLAPLLAAGIIARDGIIIDSKSGVTGAGRSAKQANLYTEVNDGIAAYGIGSHRHTPEIEQSLSWSSDSQIKVTFTPHLTPMNRGILSTIYAGLAPGKTLADARAALEKQYAHEAFVHVLPEGKTPSTHQVRGTNDCVMNVFADRIEGRIVIVSAIDNLVKGASGQAVQNMNVKFGWPEKTGLELSAVFP